MQNDLVFMVMMLGHILGDFYFQSDEMAKNKLRQYRSTLLHGLLYTLAIAGTLFLCIPYYAERVALFLSVSVCHFTIDSIKYIIEIQPENKLPWVKKNVLVLDQILHLAALCACWYCWGRKIDVRWFISQEMIHLPDLPITIVLGILFVTRPIGIWIANSNLRNFYPMDEDNESPINSAKNAGKTIGYLERVIVLVLLMYQQFGAIAFVLTAKSVARFKEIENHQKISEYYLIGTLMSVASAMFTAVFLGLVQ